MNRWSRNVQVAARGHSTVVFDLGLDPRQEGDGAGVDRVVLPAACLPKMFTRDPHQHFGSVSIHYREWPPTVTLSSKVQ